jgi:hypothetical protein
MSPQIGTWIFCGSPVQPPKGAPRVRLCGQFGVSILESLLPPTARGWQHQRNSHGRCGSGEWFLPMSTRPAQLSKRAETRAGSTRLVHFHPRQREACEKEKFLSYTAAAPATGNTELMTLTDRNGVLSRSEPHGRKTQNGSVTLSDAIGAGGTPYGALTLDSSNHDFNRNTRGNSSHSRSGFTTSF